MEMDRRDFVKRGTMMAGAVALAGGGGAWLIDRAAVSTAERTSDKEKKIKRKWIFVIDISRCDGCKICTAACNNEHYVPSGQEWIRIYDTENALGGAFFLPRPCMNCQNAPCVKVCPVKATYYNDEGVVVIDNTRCIGCRLCMAACPYQARYFNWGEPDNNPPAEIAEKYRPGYPVVHVKGTVEKCMFCDHLIVEGKLPTCVEACPMYALFFGDFNEGVVSNKDNKETWKISDILTARQAYRLREELGTEPNVYYLPGVSPLLRPNPGRGPNPDRDKEP